MVCEFVIASIMDEQWISNDLSYGEIDIPISTTNWRCRRQGHVEDYYLKGSLLGEGGCGSVYAGTRISDGLPVALKYVAKVEDDLLLPGQEVRTPREVRLMGLVNENTGHPNILRLYEWFDAPDCYVMVLERPDPCKDLMDFCYTQNKKVMDEQQARAVIDQLLHALLHCQHAGVFHRDVKPTNILINTETLRVILIDFGCGTSWKDTPFSSFAGTIDFSPPEWFAEGLYQAGPFTVWSLGVTVFDIVCGYLPFNPDDGHESMSRVHFPTGLSSEIKDFMSRCLAPEVNERATLEELQRHPWLHPTCSQQVGFRKRKMRREEDGEQKGSSSDSFIPAKCLRKDQDEWLQLLVSPTPGGEGQGHEGKGLSEHGPQAPVLSLGHEQRGARCSPRKLEPTEDDHLSHGQSSEQFLSACSSLRSYYSCQSTERRGMNEETAVKSHRENQKMAANCLTKASEKPQKAGVRKRKMGCDEQTVVQGKNLGPYSGTRPAKCPRKDLQYMGQMMHYSASIPWASRTMNPMSSWGG